MSGFLIQWQLLRRLLGLVAHSHIHEYLMDFWHIAAIRDCQPTLAIASSSLRGDSLSPSAPTAPSALVAEGAEQGSDQSLKECAGTAAGPSSAVACTSSSVAPDGYRDNEAHSTVVPGVEGAGIRPLEGASNGAEGSSATENAIDIERGTEKLQIIVCQVSPNSITISWYLYGHALANRSADGAVSSRHNLSLFVTPASNMGLDAPLLVLGAIDPQGFHRIDDLEPGKLWRPPCSPLVELFVTPIEESLKTPIVKSFLLFKDFTTLRCIITQIFMKSN